MSVNAIARDLQGFGFWVEDLRFRASGSGFRIIRVLGFGSLVLTLIWSFLKPLGSKCVRERYSTSVEGQITRALRRESGTPQGPSIPPAFHTYP